MSDPTTPTKITIEKFPHTPKTPGFGKSPTKQAFLSSSPIRKASSSPKKSHVSTLITPDYTPKLRKRKDMYDSLMNTSVEEQTYNWNYLAPQRSTVGSGRSSVKSPKKKAITEDVLVHEEVQLPSFDMKTSTPQRKARTAVRSFSSDFVTPVSKIIQEKDSWEDDFEPYYTFSSPSIIKSKNSLDIFHDTLLTPNLSHEPEILEFDPKEEILLVNKYGDKLVKKFSKIDKFDINFKPTNLLHDLINLNEPIVHNENDLINDLLADETEEEHSFRESVVNMTKFPSKICVFRD